MIGEEGKRLREQVRANIGQISAAIEQIQSTQSPILPLIVGSSQDALDLSSQLYDEGFLIPAIRYPTVPRNEARLRITLSAAHTGQQIDQLITSLAKLLPPR